MTILTTALLVLIALMLGMPADAAEKRCDDLGANCVCSEPLQMTGLVDNGAYHNPNDSTVKECNGEGLAGYAVVRNGTDLQPSTLSTILSALPAGHAVARVLKGADGHTGILQIGHQLSSSDPHARVALRWYMYFSPNFQFKFEGACMNTKFGEINDTSQGIHFDISESPAVYGFAAAGPVWSPPLDCCNAGPVDGVRNIANITPASWKGKWWRVELVIGNATGSPGVYFQGWRKNITDNLPEEKMIDTRTPCPSCIAQPWSTQAATALSPLGKRLDSLSANQYRQGTCNGYNAWSHVLKAAWSSDAGQRIGAAAEVESGAASPPPATFQLTTSTTGGGTLTGAGTYPEGASVIVLATPTAGNVLTGWGGACTGTAGCVVTMNASKSVTATFAASPTPIPVLPPPSPTGTTVSAPVPDALGVTYTVSWSPAPGAVSYGYVAGFNDGSAIQQGTIGAAALALRMPYHSSRLASTGYVCVRSVGSTGLLSADAACSSVVMPAPVVVVPPPTGTLTVGQLVSRCRFWLTSTPPDTTGGWTVKYFAGTTAVVSPVELVLGTYIFTAQWSKVGQTVRTPATVTKMCP